MDANEYLEKRLQDQIDWFGKNAKSNQDQYMLMRRLILISGWLTPLAIFVQFVLTSGWLQNYWSIVPMILSTTAVGTYQWEEIHKFGAKWSKFRLVAEQLRHHRFFFETKTGPYRGLSDQESLARLVQTTEGIIEGTDVNYFTLVIDPTKDPVSGD